LLNGPAIADWIVNDRPFAFRKFEAEAHRLERKQNIRENYGRIERESIDWLKSDLRRQLRRLAHFENRVFGSERAIFGHVAAGLTHEPHGGALDRFTPAGFEKTFIHREAF
jgi:hypothetical protein